MRAVVTGKRIALNIAITGNVTFLRMNEVQNNAASGASRTFLFVPTCDILRYTLVAKEVNKNLSNLIY